MGWLNFHSKLVQEVQKGDEKQVCKRLPMNLQLLLFLLLCNADAPAWPYCVMSPWTYYEAGDEQQH